MATCHVHSQHSAHIADELACVIPGCSVQQTFLQAESAAIAETLLPCSAAEDHEQSKQQKELPLLVYTAEGTASCLTKNFSAQLYKSYAREVASVDCVIGSVESHLRCLLRLTLRWDCVLQNQI